MGSSTCQPESRSLRPMEPRSDRVQAHIRDVLGLPHVARFFKDKRMDGNAATVFERADFMAPKPDGLGLAEDDKDLDAIMQFIEELKKCEAKKSSAIAAVCPSRTPS